MPTKLFVNLPVKDLKRSEAFFTGLGFAFFGMTDDMASVIISELPLDFTRRPRAKESRSSADRYDEHR
jgi:hypothetical protein